MRHSFHVLFLLAFIAAACTPNQNPVPVQSATQSALPTSTPPPIPPSPTIAPTPTASPTPELPVGLKTAIPEIPSTISADNLGHLTELARYYGNVPYIAKLTKDQTRLFVRNQIGVDIYDYNAKKLILHVDHFALAIDDILGLQISDDGKWALIDGVWLLDTETDTAESDLRNVYELAGFKTAPNPVPLTALSPDGKKLAIGELYESGRFYIVDLETKEILYKSIQGSSPVFSPDNSMIATNMQNQVIVWSLSDARPMQDFPLESFGKGVTFSRDSTLIAIRQSSGNIDIWNIKSDEKIKSIPSNSGACYNVRTGFSSIPLFSHDKELAVFDCNGNVQVWSVTGNLLSEQHYDTDVPSVFFDDQDNFALLAPPHSTGPWNGYEEYQLHDFLFLDNETIGFQYYDSARRTYRGCTLSLQAGTPSCTDNLFFGTDNKYYNYTIKGNSVQLFAGSTAASQPLDEFPWKGLQAGTINGFDPVHSLLLYTSYPTQYTSETSLTDLGTGEVLSKWDKRGVGAVAFSADNKVAALCLDLTGYGITFFTNKGKLSLIDLANKAIAYEEAFTCSHVALSHSAESRQLAASYEVLPPGSKYLKSMLMLMNFNKPNERKKIDIGCDRNIGALTYSPDDSLLVAGCTYGNSNGTIHFLNASDGTERYQLEGYQGISGLAFSQDGKLLTISFGGGVISTLAIPPTKS